MLAFVILHFQQKKTKNTKCPSLKNSEIRHLWFDPELFYCEFTYYDFILSSLDLNTVNPEFLFSFFFTALVCWEFII